MNIAVFLSASEVAPDFKQTAIELGQLIAKRGHNLVYGGSDNGLMKVLADNVQAGGAKLIGITVTRLEHVLRQNCDEKIILATVEQRKNLMLERSDALIVLPGGYGTLDELATAIEQKVFGNYSKPIIVINHNGFYDGLKSQFELYQQLGFNPLPLDKLVRFVAGAEQAMEMAIAWKPEVVMHPHLIKG